MNALANGINSLAPNNDSINMFYGGNLEYFENFEPQPFRDFVFHPIYDGLTAGLMRITTHKTTFNKLKLL